MPISREADHGGDETSRKLTELARQASMDATLKEKLRQNLALVLREHGIVVPAGCDVSLLETPGGPHLLMTPKSEMELTDEQLRSVAGGTGAAQSAKGEKPIEFLKIKQTQVFVTS